MPKRSLMPFNIVSFLMVAMGNQFQIMSMSHQVV